MDYNKLGHLSSERDLETYKDYLKENYCETDIKPIAEVEDSKMMTKQNNYSVPKMLTSPVFSHGYLKNHQGKLMKIECLIGNNLDSRIGVLLDVGADYIVIKLGQSCCSLMIPTQSIKYITIIHDNGYRLSKHLCFDTKSSIL